MRYKLILLIIAGILFFIPFFWFAPGEMDLGGDSSRLYFYDPLSYLKNHTLYGISPSGLGAENIGYYSLPFITLLVFLKFILRSPTILISLFHGLKLAVAFLSCYLVVKELISSNEHRRKEIIEYAALLSALSYVFSPSLIRGWDKAILTHDQVFLNPLMFFLFLRYFRTTKLKFLLGALVLTFIFSQNFSFFAAPPVFAFYPLSILFLLLYTRIVLKKPIIWQHLLGSFFVFVGLQAFHLFPQLRSLFSPGSGAYNVVFSDEEKFSRGLGYFSAIAPNIKVSINLMGLPQMMEFGTFSWIFIIFPIIILLGFLWNKGKTLLLTGVFFLVALFFATANITNFGLKFYKALFNIPGFSMFRNFYGQWVYVFLFYYTILLGQALLLVLSKLKKIQKRVVILGIGFFLVLTARPFISGELINKVLWQSKDVQIVTKIDPSYEETLAFIRSLPVDGKVLTLPLTDPGYQILAGKDGGGAYQGPSTISYLTGKKDFAGFNELGPFRDIFLIFSRDKKYQELKNILSFLSIKYIFHNSDPNVYEEKFPAFPYEHVLNFMPDNQKSYANFIQSLNVFPLASFASRYHFYEIDDKDYLPHLYIANRRMYWDQQFAQMQIPLSFYTPDNTVAINIQDIQEDISKEQIKLADDIFLKAQNNSLFLEFIKKRKESEFPSPYVSRKLSSLIYPLVVLREKKQLESFAENDDIYIDKSIFFAEKRVNELDEWGKEVPLIGDVTSIEALSESWQEPKLWEIKRFKEYNSWEISLARYERLMVSLIKKMETFNKSNYSSITNKVHLKDVLVLHRKKINNIIKEVETISEREKIYLLKLSDKMFEHLITSLSLNIPDLANTNIEYVVNNIPSTANYEVYIEKNPIKNFDQSKLMLAVDDKKLFPTSFQPREDWLRFDDIGLRKETAVKIIFNVSQYSNLVEKTAWRQLEKIMEATNSASLMVDDTSINNTKGLVREISGWSPKFQYFISFDYLTYGKDFKVKLYERGGRKTADRRQIIEESLRSKEWKTYKTVVESGEAAKSAFLQILKDEDDLLGELEDSSKMVKIEIKNLSVIQVPHPEIILREVLTPEGQERSIPKITFKKINPTKYKIRIENATQPYTLVFLEAFNQNWRFVNVNKDTKTMRARITRLLGNVGRYVVSFFVKTNTFLEPDTFETWGKAEIAEYAHWPVNGYANSWYITPGDIDGKTDYEMILEMTTQKLFYGSLALSILTFITTLSYGIYKIRKA